MKNLFRVLIGSVIISVLVVAGCCVGIANHIQNTKVVSVDTRIEKNGTMIGTILQESEERIITSYYVGEKLDAIGELATYSYEYEGGAICTNQRQLFGINVPFTSNALTMTGDVLIKFGYDLSEVYYEVDTEHGLILFELPEPEILSDDPVSESIQCEETNNILNPIESDDVVSCIEQVEADAIANAETNGIYDKAEEEMKSLIEHYVSDIPGYTVEFI